MLCVPQTTRIFLNNKGNTTYTHIKKLSLQLFTHNWKPSFKVKEVGKGSVELENGCLSEYNYA